MMELLAGEIITRGRGGTNTPPAQSDSKSAVCSLAILPCIQSAPALQEADVPLPCVVPIAVVKECGCNYVE